MCALADEEDMSIGILLAADAAGARLFAPLPPRPPLRIRLGKMWAAPAAGEWKLIEALSPAWEQG